MTCSNVPHIAGLMVTLWALSAVPAWAQQTAEIRGTVTDSTSDAPVAGAQIFVAGTQLGALTNENGRYTIVGVPSGLATVRVQSMGYTSAERRVTLQADQVEVIDFGIAPSAVALEEVVVVGYGTRTRRDLSTSVASVAGTEIQNTPVAGLDGALQGKAAGVFVVQNAGNPGNGITVRIRGSASLSASNQPLYVVDGVPILRDSYSQLGVGGQDLTAVTGLSPDDIGSIDILKDAAAAAIYGSRASNGVVLITTKRGAVAAPTRVTFSAYTGLQEVPRQIDVLSGAEYVEFLAEAARNDGEEPPLTLDDIAAETNWQDAIFQVAPVSNASLAVSGGTERVQYHVAGSFFDQEGIVVGSQYNRASGRVNLDFRASDRLSLSASVALSREDHDRIQGDGTTTGVVTNALANQPIYPVKRPDGTFTGTDDGLEYVNPVAMAELTTIESRTLRALGNLEAVLDLGEGLRWRSLLGLDILNLRDFRWDSPEINGSYAASVDGVSRQGNTTANRYLLESYLNYERATGTLGSLSATAGASVEFSTEEWDWLRGERFPSPQFRYAGNAGTVTEFDAGKTEYNLVSVFSRATYDLFGRYFLTASLRADGSSRFGVDHRYGIFPAASLGWTIGDEAFMDWLRPIGTLKLRASYGETGNQDIGDDYAPLGRFGPANYADEPGIAPTDLANPELRWETTREFDIGVDFDMFDGRLLLTTDYYIKNTDDLLVNRPITSASGYTAFWDNIGSIQNRGFEVGIESVNLQPSAPDGLRWTTNFNVSFNQNEVTELYRGEPFNDGVRDINRVEEGQPLGAFHALRFEGVDAQTGDAIFHDANNDGVINADDRVIVGSPHPDYWGGLSNTLSWRGFELSTFLELSMGAEVFYAVRMFGDDGGYYFDNKFGNVLDRWQKPGDVTDVPRASFNDTSGSRHVSSRYIEDGSYIRIQDVSLSYRLPPAIARFARMQDLSVFTSVHNLYMFTDYSGYDPNVNSNGSGTNIALGTDYYAYPIPRTFSIGIRGAW